MALREDRMTWLGSMVRIMVQVFQQMRCIKPEQDNFTYYTVNPVSVPVPTLAKENCRWCKILDTEENIYEPVIFPGVGEETTASILVEEKVEPKKTEKVWTA